MGTGCAVCVRGSTAVGPVKLVIVGGACGTQSEAHCSNVS